METETKEVNAGEVKQGGKIYRALAAVQARVKSAAKSGENKHFNYSYATLHDYCEVIRTPMAENGLALSVDIANVDRLTPRKTRNGEQQCVIVKVIGVLMHESGESISFTGYGEGLDDGDKAIYKAITGAKKYLIANIFNVPTSDDPEKDSDAERDQGKQRPPAQQRPPQQQTPQQQRPPQQPPVQQQRPPTQQPPAQQRPPAQMPPQQPPQYQQPPVQTPPPAAKTNEQREAEGCINAQQYDNITSALVANKIASKQWRMWLKACYNCDSAKDIKQEMLEGINQTIESVPDTIKNFGK